MEKSFSACLFAGWLRLQGLFPLKIHHFRARILAFLVEKVFRYRRDVVTENLSQSFPDKSSEEIKSLSHRFYRHFATILTEMIWLGGRRGEKGRARLRKSHLVEFTNPGEFNRILADSSQMMMFFAHTGNWELIPGLPVYSYGEKLKLDPRYMTIVYRRLSDKISEEAIFYHRMAMLEGLGTDGLIESYDIKQYACDHREQGRIFMLITDQYPYGGRKNIEVEFMNRRTPTMSAAAKLAVKFDMAAVYMRYECREGGGYRLTLVPISEHAGSEDPADLMQRYYRLLEQDLRTQPWNYLWTHRRWKTETRDSG